MILAMSADQALAASSPQIDDVRAVAQEVWSTFLGHTEPLLTDVELVELTPQWSASVTIKGEWNGMVAIELTTAGAHQLTAAMLGLGADDEVADADVVDAVGELVNMVGGNIKGLVPGPSRLSLPLVAAGQFAHGTGQVEMVRLNCTWNDEPVVMTVHAGRAAVSRLPR